MSGGAYDYVTFKNASEVVNHPDFKAMLWDAEKLNLHHFLAKAQHIERLIQEANRLWQEIHTTAHDLEWYASGDYGIDQVHDCP